MDSFSERRLAENETIFKKLNTEAKNFALEGEYASVFGDMDMRFYCECSNLVCRERIKLKASKYDELHGNPKWFIVKPGHALKEIEKVIRRNQAYEVVEKYEVPPTPTNIDPKILLEKD